MENSSFSKQKKHTILIIDDNPINLKLIASSLIDNYKLLIADNGENGIKAAIEQLPSLILLDIMMPNIDGYEVISKLKLNPLTSEIPVIFVTAKHEAEDIIKGFECGAVDFISKPFNKEVLLVRVKSQLELKDIRDELVKINKLKIKFIQIIAHDLRNPFHALLGLLQIIHNELDNLSKEQIRKYISELLLSSNSTFQLLVDILEWSRLQSELLEPDYSQFCLKELIDEQISFHNTASLEKKIKVQNNIPEDIKISSDINMVSTVIRNLISNSIKYSFENGLITIDIKSTRKFHEISVTDQGLGIPLEIKNKLFEIDRNTKTDGTKNEKGTGMGLILCSEFIKLLNGTIDVDKNLTSGTRIYFTIPK